MLDELIDLALDREDASALHAVELLEDLHQDPLGHLVGHHPSVVILQSKASSIRHNNTSKVILRFQPFMKECIVLSGSRYIKKQLIG